MRESLIIVNDARDATRLQDAWAVNSFVEKEGEELKAVKRPGLITVVPTVGTIGQGLFNWNGFGCSVINDVLYRFLAPVIFNPPTAFSFAVIYPTGTPVIYNGAIYYSTGAWNNTMPYPEDTLDSVVPYPISGDPGVIGGVLLRRIKGTSPIFWSSTPPTATWSWTFISTGHTETGYGSPLAVTQAASQYGGTNGYTFVATSLGVISVSDPHGNPWYSSSMGAFSFTYTTNPATNWSL